MSNSNGHQKPKSLNLDKLIKLLKLTTSPNDAEALLAARKANEVLGNFGGDWEALLLSKVTIIADPFDNLPPMPPARSASPQAASPQAQAPFGTPPRPQTVPPRPSPPPPPPPPPPPLRRDCAHCGTSYNLLNGYGMQQRYCSNRCNTAANPPYKRPDRSTRMKPTLADL
jgi:hypothetical protein